MAARSEPLWQVGRPWLSTVRVLTLVALSPVLIGGAVVGAVVSLVTSAFPPRASSANDMAEGLTTLLTADDDSWDMDDAIGDVVGRTYSDPRLEELKQRVKQLPDLPWDQSTIQEVAAMRDAARAIAEEGMQNDR